MDASNLYTTLTISSIKEEARDVKIFELEGGPRSYQAGQYLTFVYRDGPSEVRRSYSLVSAPALGEPPAVGIKRVENGVFSRPLVDHARPGDQLLTTGAGGFFVLPHDRQSVDQVFFLAAGIGITPIYALLKTALHDWPGLQVVLIYSNASPAVTVFYRQLQELAAAFPGRLQVEFLFSNAPDLYRAHLHADLLVALWKQYSTAPPARQLFYTCGPVNYMRMCTYTLQREGIPEAHIRRENFFPRKAVQRLLPPDTDPHGVTIYWKQEKILVPVQYPDTILQAAKKQGIALPYSCESGVCGNCAARCIQGQVWLSHNEVLTDKERAEGMILTCTGHAVGGDVVLIV
ncbi:iron-sulfur cluster-binding domain-containing protein [Paraflavisolibacter sp. H34]|uniref:flavin reductase family protein n=1 Tax=Huijunlia imazamoxiresistens TaxID=3127457 RepID=UPI0030180230